MYQASLTDSDGNPTIVASDDSSSIVITDSSNYLSSNGNRYLFSLNDFRYISVKQPDNTLYILSTIGTSSPNQTLPYVNQQGSTPANSFTIPNTVGDGRYDVTLVTVPKYFLNVSGDAYQVGDIVTYGTGGTGDPVLFYRCIQIDPATTVNHITNTAYWAVINFSDITSGKYFATTTIFVVADLNKRFFYEVYKGAVYTGTGIEQQQDPDKNDDLNNSIKLFVLREGIENAVDKHNWLDAQAMLNYSKNLEDID